jgi:hypothetical protein
MADAVVAMDRDAVLEVAKGFQEHSQTLQKLIKQTEQVINRLTIAGLVAPAIAAALKALLQVLTAVMTVLRMRCDEFANDLQQAASDHAKGDVAGKRYFGEGLRK